MKARFDTLFGRLFGVLFAAIVLAHLLAFAWFRLYGPPPPPPPPEFSANIDGQPPMRDAAYPPRQARPWFGGPVVPLTFQFITLMIAAWYGAKLLTRPIQRLSDAAERLSEDLDSAPSTNPARAKPGKRRTPSTSCNGASANRSSNARACSAPSPTTCARHCHA